VARRFDPARGPMLTALTAAASAARVAVDARRVTYVEVFACPADLARVTSVLTPRYAPVESGDGFTIFRSSR
jgi:hypothetical protein